MYRITAVCTGNICRSPMAEFMIADALAAAGLAGSTRVDSAGTSDWERDNPIDPRAAERLYREGIDAADHRARRFEQSWFAERDLVLALDTDHFAELAALAPTARARGKIRMLRSFDPAAAGLAPSAQGIYDPWFGDSDDFEVTWELISAALPGIVAHVLAATTGATRPGDGLR